MCHSAAAAHLPAFNILKLLETRARRVSGGRINVRHILDQASEIRTDGL